MRSKIVNVPTRGFGMPPAVKDRHKKTIGAFGVESLATGEQIAGNTATTEAQTTKTGYTHATATDDFKDKYTFSLPSRTVPSKIPVDPSHGVVGSLRRHIEFWKRLDPGETILSTIRDGYKIPFFETPHSAYFKNNKSAIIHSDFVSKEIQNLLETGRIREVKKPPTVVNPLSVATNSTKPRLILDLRYVNTHLWSQRVKYEDFRTFSQYLKQGAYMFSFDLKSGYHHIEIFAEHCQYLGFSWTENGVTRFFVFLVLPFGLATAGYIFTKVVRVLVRLWRSQGIKIVVFLDDGIGISENARRSREIARTVRWSLSEAGFIVNDEKSVWEPVQLILWLGLLINTNPLSLKIAPKRITKLLSKLDNAMSQSKISARQMAGITGTIRSQDIVIGHIGALFSRSMNKFIAEASSLDDTKPICCRVLEELRFWSQNIESLNFKALDRRPSPPAELTIKINSDASSVASGAILKQGKLLLSAHKNLSAFEASLSSTWRELDAIRFALDSFKPHLVDTVVVWATDNDPAVKIMNKGSRKPHLQALAVDIYHLCRRNRIAFNPVWVARDFNCEADALSKVIDIDDWTTSRAFYEFIDARWGPFTIDRFASSVNSKVARFNSKFWNPGCEAVDAFSQDWGSDLNWVVPPTHLICRVIHHASDCQASGALLVPLWRSAAFWPLMFNDDGVAQPWVIDSITFLNTGGILQLGDFKGSLMGSQKFRSPLVILRFDFKVHSRSGDAQDVSSAASRSGEGSL